jgi:glycosyltransferase involved in cell wall biosynthesis
LFVNSKFGFFGGVERYVYDTAMLLHDNGWECRGIFEHGSERRDGFDEPFASVDIGSDYDKYIKTIKDQGCEMAFIHKISDAALLKKLNRHFRTIVFVHDHDYYCLRRHKYFPVTRKNCRFCYNPVLCSLCSGLMKKDGKSPVKVSPVDFKGYISIFRELKKCDSYIVMSDFMRDNLVANGFEPAKISKLYPVKKCRELAASPDSGEILYAGQLIRGKGVDLLVEAMKFVDRSRRLRIVGTGNDEGYIKSLIEANKLGSRVKMVGWCDDMDACYRDCDVVVVPSRWQEPFGMIGVEAFSHGRAVVAFDVGGISEWLKDGFNGLLTPAGDTRRLAADIETLLNDKELRDKMGQNGYKMVKKDYNEDIFIKRFGAIVSGAGKGMKEGGDV